MLSDVYYSLALAYVYSSTTSKENIDNNNTDNNISETQLLEISLNSIIAKKKAYKDLKATLRKLV